MEAILNSLYAHNLPICQPILMILVSKFMVHIALSDKPYLSLRLPSPLKYKNGSSHAYCIIMYGEIHQNTKC